MTRLHQLMQELTEQAAAIRAESQPYREQLNELLVEMNPFVQRENELRTKIMEIERPRLAEIETQRGALALSLSLAEPGKHHRVKFVQMQTGRLSEAPKEVQAAYAAAKAR